MVTTRSYDKLNRLLGQRSDFAGQVTPVYSTGYDYNDANQRVRKYEPDGSYWVYAYDNLGQVTSGKRYWADGSPVAGQQFEYAFDDIGNRSSAKSGGDANGLNLRTTSYSVNLLNQYSSRNSPSSVDIIGAAAPSATVTVNSGATVRKGEYFWKDLAVSNGSGPASTSVSIAASSGGSSTGKLLWPAASESPTYDDDGNLLSDSLWTYTWNGENRLVAMQSQGGVATDFRYRLEFIYDWMGRRIQKVSKTWDTMTSAYNSGTKLKFLYDGWNILSELDSSNNQLRTYMWGPDLSGSLTGAGGVGGLLSMYDFGTSKYQFYSYDGNGNVGALVNQDGTATARYDYGPFGELVRSSGALAKANPFRFSTKYQDDESGLSYYGYRFYDSLAGRWPNRDPFGEPGFELLQDGAPDVLGDGPNLYCFVENDPIGGYDFLGLKSRCDNDTDCMRCLLFHEGRGQNNKCLEALRNVIANRAKLNNRDICAEAKSGAYSGAKSSSGNYSKCCNQNWCADITKDKNGNPIKPYNPDKEDMSKIDDFIGSGGVGSSDGSLIRFHDKSISKPPSWGDEFVEVPVSGCDNFKFYKKVPKPPKTKKTPKK